MSAADSEEPTLLVAGNKTGYLSVRLSNRGGPKLYVAQVTRGGKKTIFLSKLLACCREC